MTIRPSLALAVFVTLASSLSFAQSQDADAAPAGFTPNATTTVTTTGGTTNKLAKFSGTSTITNSSIYDNGTNVGIATTSPTATLEVNGSFTVDGSSTMNNQLLFSAGGTATASGGFSSHSLKFNGSAYNSSTSSVVQPRFQWTAEVTGNNTSSPNGTLNLLASPGTPSLAETGLYINTNGTIHFATGQTLPGGSSFCVATAGGFGGGGTTFVEPSFVMPAANHCASWAGWTKTAGTVIVTTSGTACMSSSGKTLQLSFQSADPDWFGAGAQGLDYIRLTRSGSSGTFTGGTDQGSFSGGANQVTCTSSLLTLPDTHD